MRNAALSASSCCRSSAEPEELSASSAETRTAGRSCGSQRLKLCWISQETDGQRDAYLDPGLGQLGPLGQLLAGVDVGVMRPFKGLLQLLQLFRRKGGPTPPLLPLQGEVRLRVHVRHFIHPTT